MDKHCPWLIGRPTTHSTKRWSLYGALVCEGSYIFSDDRSSNHRDLEHVWLFYTIVLRDSRTYTGITGMHVPGPCQKSVVLESSVKPSQSRRFKNHWLKAFWGSLGSKGDSLQLFNVQTASSFRLVFSQILILDMSWRVQDMVCMYWAQIDPHV